MFTDEKNKRYHFGDGLTFYEDDIDHNKTAELHKKDKTLNHYTNDLERVVAEKNRLDELRSSRIITIEPTTNIQRHKELTDLMHQTYIEKNKDYGDSFGQTHKKYGALAGLTRIADKFHRLENIILNDATIQVDDESVIDTLVDMSNYGLLLAMELEEK